MRWDSLTSAALGAALGLLAGWTLARDRETAAPRVPVPAAVSLEPLLAELRAIRASLEQPLAPLAGPTVGAPPQRERAPAGDPLGEELRALVAALRAEREQRAAAPPPMRELEDDGPRAPDLAALRAARARLAGPEPQVVPELFGLSPEQVYRRFGTPAVVGNSPGRVRWLYADPDGPGRLVVTFMEGYVAWVSLATE